MPGKRAVIIGGSMSGLLSGLMLRRAGWDVDIYERVDSELSGRGAGIVAQYELIERLRALGLATDALGVAITTRKILDREGRLTEQFDCPQVLTAWERVYRLLRDAFPPQRYHRGRGFAGFEPRAEKVLARFSDGETIAADLLVGADGTRSTVRQQALPEAVPLYAGYCAWRALIAESDFPPDVHDELFEYMTFALPPGEQLLGYPVAGPDNDLRPGPSPLQRGVVPAGRRADQAAVAAHRRARRDARDFDPAAADPARGDRRDARRRRAAGGAAVPPSRAADGRSRSCSRSTISNRRAWHSGGWRFSGDAAFVARPHVAAGVSKAADDAAALAAALTAEPDVPAALRRFEAARLGENFRIIERARHLGAYLQATQTSEERERAGRHSTDSAVIEETAVLDFLRA